MKKFRFTALLLCLTVLCCALLALAACNDSGSSGQSGSTGEEDPPAEKTVSVADVYDANVNEDGLAADITLAKQQKILSSIAGAENVNYLTDRTAIVEMADGTSHLFDITAAFSAEDKSFLENIADAIYAAANLDPDATITEAQEQATIQALKAAAQQFAADAEQIIQNVSVDFVQLPQIDQSVELRENISEFAGFEQVVFSPMTESMAFTAEGNLESENCTMSYAFGINLDSSITAFVVTYADNGETAQEKIDNLANPSAAIISEVGTFPASVDFTSQLPQLVQAPATISADTLYKQVFGEDYSFTKFDEFFQNLMGNVLSNVSSYKVLAVDLSQEGFKVYSDAVLRQGRTVLAVSTYNGTLSSNIAEYYNFSSQLGDLTFEDYIYSLIGTANIPANEEQQVLSELAVIKEKTDECLKIINLTTANQFATDTPIMNTSTNIEFADFAKQFIPTGTEPVFCYVGPISGNILDNRFGTGYTQQFKANIGYIDSNSGKLLIENFTVYVPWYTNTTDLEAYNLALQEEGTNYIRSESETTEINSPILTGATSGIEAEAESEATR